MKASAARRLDVLARNEALEPALRADLFDQAGNAWMVGQDHARAIAAIDAALALAERIDLPPEARAQFRLDRARAGLAAGDLETARTDLDISIELAALPLALTLRARIEREAKDYERASADVRRAFLLDPDCAEAYLERGRIKRSQGDTAGAREDFLKIAALSNDEPELANEAQREIAAMDTPAE